MDRHYSMAPTVILDVDNGVEFTSEALGLRGNRQPKLQCFECDGTLQHITEDYSTTAWNGEHIAVRNVPMHRCDKCGETVIGDAGNQLIDDAIGKYLFAKQATKRNRPWTQ